jgi:hypothetical protein
VFLIVDFSAVSDGGNDNRFLVFVEDDAPVSDSQPHAASSLQPFYVAVPGRRKEKPTDIN